MNETVTYLSFHLSIKIIKVKIFLVDMQQNGNNSLGVTEISARKKGSKEKRQEVKEDQ